MAAAILYWTTAVSSAFSLPKFAIVSFGMLAAAAAVAAGAPLELERSLARPLGLALALLAVSTILSDDPWLSFIGHYNAYATGLWALAMAAALHVLGASLDDRWAGRLESLLVGLAAALGAYAIAQIAGLDPVLSHALPTGNRAVATIGSPVDLGALLAGLFPLSLHYARQGRWPWRLAAVAAAAGMAATGSRGSWLAAAAASGVYLFMGDGLAALRASKRTWIGAALLTALLLGAGAVRTTRSWKNSDSTRVEVWKVAWQGFKERPWLGSGPDTFEQTFRRLRTPDFIRISISSRAIQAHAHNDLLQALTTTGLAGLAAYLLVLFAVARAAKEALAPGPRRDSAAAAIGGLLAIFINLKFNPLATEVHLLAALLAAHLCRARPSSSQTLGAPARAALVAAALGSAILAFNLYRADANFQRGKNLARAGQGPAALVHLNQAAARVPQELEYKIVQLNLIGDLINATRDIPERLRLLKIAHEAGKEAVRLRPYEVNSHYLAATAHLMHAQLGLREHLGASVTAFEEATRLDPLMTNIQLARLEAEKLLGDPARIRAAEQALERARAVHETAR